MLMSPNKGETAVHGCHCPGDMVVRMRTVLAIPRGWYVCLSADKSCLTFHPSKTRKFPIWLTSANEQRTSYRSSIVMQMTNQKNYIFPLSQRLYWRPPADQKARRLWVRDCGHAQSAKHNKYVKIIPRVPISL